MTYSQNFEVVMQIFGRVLRKSPNIPMKYFFKVAPKNTAGYFVDWMNAMFMLFDEEWFSKYNGKNGFDIRIPNTLIKGTPKSKSSNGGGKSNKGKVKPHNIEFFNSLSFMDENGWFKMNDKLVTVASTTLREVCIMHGFFNNPHIKNQNSEKMPFDEAHNFVKNLKLKNAKEWFAYCDGKLTHLPPKPRSIPRMVYLSYANDGFINLPHFLGCESNGRNREFLSYSECKQWFKDNNIKSASEWNKWKKKNKKPSNIPSCPRDRYPNEFTYWSDFLDTNCVAPQMKKFREFEKAREYVRSLNFSTLKEFREWIRSDKRPYDIPAAPNAVKQYKSKWISERDFFQK
jgi:hypothetical protein